MIDLAKYWADFRVEAAEHLRALNDLLLRLERSPNDRELVREMFLSAHTIKGSAGMMGLTDLASLAHGIEDVLGALRDEQRPLDGPTADLLFDALDSLGQLVDTPPDQVAQRRPEIEALLGRLAECRRRASRPQQPAATCQDAAPAPSLVPSPPACASLTQPGGPELVAVRRGELQELVEAAALLSQRLQEEQSAWAARLAPLAGALHDSLRDLASQPAPPRQDLGGSRQDPGKFERAGSDHGQEAAMPPRAPERQRVLLVEDSATVRVMESIQLTEAGLQVDATASGHDALRMALETPYQLVVTGVEISGLRGFDLAASLRRQPTYRATPIIIMSTSDDPEYRRQAKEVGATAYVRRSSVDRRQLVACVQELLGRR